MMLTSVHNNLDLLINFKGMSLYLGAFYAKKLENCVHYIYIYIFCVFKNLLHMVI